jgi:ATP-binding cassette subfamily B protein
VIELKNNIKRIKTVWRFAKPYTPLFVIAEICILVSYTIALLLPINLSALTDNVLTSNNYTQLPEVIRNYIILLLISIVFNLIYAYVWQSLNNKYVVEVKNAVFEKAIRAKADFLSNMNSGDIMSRIDGDANEFINIVQRNLFHFVNSIILCFGIIFMVANINLIVSFLLIAAALLPIVLTRLSGRFTQKFSKESREINGEFTGRFFEILKGMREIRLLCAEWWATNNIFTPLKKLIRLSNNISKIDFIVNKGTYLINLSISLVIYSFCVTLIYQNQLTIGLFLAIIQYIALLHKKFNWLLRIYLDWYARKISVDRVDYILNCESETDDGESLNAQIGVVEFKNVVFGYDDKPILDNVSFKITKGQKVAIVGTSGVGKTTLTGLILKFFKPQQGEIFINGQNINDIKYSDIRNQIGIVQQDILLFDETIRYNLILGNNQFTDDEIFKACEKVGLLELIKGLPNGLNTKIGLNTYGLSGGQKQRLMLARILLKNVRTIIFDEATSALDVETEEMVIDEFASANPDTTMIVISHRLSAIKNCDKIIVIDNGAIDCIGTHKDLIDNSEIYKSLFTKEAA